MVWGANPLINKDLPEGYRKLMKCHFYSFFNKFSDFSKKTVHLCIIMILFD